MTNPKKKIVEKLLNKTLEINDEEELLDLLVDQPLAIDVDKLDEKTRTFGDKLADKLTNIAGSWGFIIGFTLFLIIWIILNLFIIKNLDPYPFILLNLLLSCLAALQAPIIMMSQNREAKKDSLRNLNDYKTDLKSELILEQIHDKLNDIIANQGNLQREINLLNKRLDELEKK
jgi:uncharacterized membrane protein